MKSDIGKFGGENENAIERILGEITMEPIILSEYDCESVVFEMDTNKLMGELREVDLVYYDPPYNQHPYGSNYHMLNTIVDYVEPATISEVAGIPKGWKKSLYNKKLKAQEALEDLLEKTCAKYIMISYNSEGFITYDEMKDMCEKKGAVQVFDIVYNTFRGSRNLKDRDIHVKEFIFLIKVA